MLPSFNSGNHRQRDTLPSKAKLLENVRTCEEFNQSMCNQTPSFLELTLITIVTITRMMMMMEDPEKNDLLAFCLPFLPRSMSELANYNLTEKTN